MELFCIVNYTVYTVYAAAALDLIPLVRVHNNHDISQTLFCGLLQRRLQLQITWFV